MFYVVGDYSNTKLKNKQYMQKIGHTEKLKN